MVHIDDPPLRAPAQVSGQLGRHLGPCTLAGSGATELGRQANPTEQTKANRQASTKRHLTVLAVMAVCLSISELKAKQQADDVCSSVKLGDETSGLAMPSIFDSLRSSSEARPNHWDPPDWALRPSALLPKQFCRDRIVSCTANQTGIARLGLAGGTTLPVRINEFRTRIEATCAPSSAFSHPTPEPTSQRSRAHGARRIST